MLNGVVALTGGIFLGAVGAEIIRRKWSHALDGLYAKSREVTSAAKEAFKRGYQRAAQSRQSAAPRD